MIKAHVHSSGSIWLYDDSRRNGEVPTTDADNLQLTLTPKSGRDLIETIREAIKESREIRSGNRKMRRAKLQRERDAVERCIAECEADDETQARIDDVDEDAVANFDEGKQEKRKPDAPIMLPVPDDQEPYDVGPPVDLNGDEPDAAEPVGVAAAEFDARKAERRASRKAARAVQTVAGDAEPEVGEAE